MEPKAVDHASFFQKLREQLPSFELITASEDLLIYAHGTNPVEYKWILQGSYKYLPGGILRPSSAIEVSRVLQIASEMRIPLIPIGGASGIVGGTVADSRQLLLDTKRLVSFSLSPQNCTASGGAGLTAAEFEERLNRQGFTSGHFPQSAHSATLGGMAATRAVGTFSTKYGKIDDMITALEVVLPDGAIMRTHPAPKRSSGPELMQLFLGSEGALGVITEVQMKVYPLPECRLFQTCTFPETRQALQSVRRIVQGGLRPAAVRLYDEHEAREWLRLFDLEQGWCFLVLVLEGGEEMTRLEARLALQICKDHGGRDHGPEGAQRWFQGRYSTRKMLEYHRRKGATADALEVAAPWEHIEKVWREMRQALEPLSDEVDCHFSHFYHSGASVYVIFYVDTGSDDKAAEQRYKDCLKQAIEASLRNGGNISHHHGIGRTKAAWLKEEHGEGGVELLRRIKRALDPQAIMNPGVLGL